MGHGKTLPGKLMIIHWNWAEQLHFRCDLTTQIQKRLETVLVLPIHPDSDGPYGPSHHVKKSGLRVDNHFQLVWVAQWHVVSWSGGPQNHPKWDTLNAETTDFGIFSVTFSNLFQETPPKNIQKRYVTPRICADPPVENDFSKVARNWPWLRRLPPATNGSSGSPMMNIPTPKPLQVGRTQ